MKVQIKSMKESIDDSYTKVLSKLGELQKQGKFPGGNIVGNDIDGSLADNEILIKGDDGSDIAGFKSALDQLKGDDTIANYFVNPDDTIIVTLKESKKKSKKEGVRIARYGEFDNGHVLHSWEHMSIEDAEKKARDASLNNPDDIFYVAVDDIMNPDTENRWINGKKYRYDQVEIRDGKPHVKESKKSKKESKEVYVDLPDDLDTFVDFYNNKKYDELPKMIKNDLRRECGVDKEYWDDSTSHESDLRDIWNSGTRGHWNVVESKKKSKKESSSEALKKVKERVKKEFPDFEVKGPVPEVYDKAPEGRDQYLIAVPDDSTEGREVEKMLREVESEYPDTFEYEGVDWDNRYWFNIPKE